MLYTVGQWQGGFFHAVGGVGYPEIHVLENDTGPDDCNHAQHGAFILAAANSPVQGPVEGVHLLDIAPTLLELGGYDRPPWIRGPSLAAGRDQSLRRGGDDSARDEMLVRDRLSGLGYLG